MQNLTVSPSLEILRFRVRKLQYSLCADITRRHIFAAFVGVINSEGKVSTSKFTLCRDT